MCRPANTASSVFDHVQKCEWAGIQIGSENLYGNGNDLKKKPEKFNGNAGTGIRGNENLKHIPAHLRVKGRQP